MVYRSQKLVNRRRVSYSKWHYSMQGAWRAYLRSVVKWLTDMDAHHHANGTFNTPTRLPEASISCKNSGAVHLGSGQGCAQDHQEDATAQAAEKAACEAGVSDRAKLQRQRRLASEKAAQSARTRTGKATAKALAVAAIKPTSWDTATNS